ncbi:MAG: YfhO family protein [Bryobacterales bacterium]|nr:YfhO family protein [Bryobacterales bacterium]
MTWKWLLAVAAAVVLLFWKITLSGQFTWMNGDDTVNQVLPWLQMQAREWHRGHFPLLDFHWSGQSLIGQSQPGATYPLNWLLFVLPFTHGRLQTPILNGYFVFIHILGAWAMFALLRTLSIARPIAAVIAVAFGAGGYMAVIDWPQMLNGAVWLPVALLFWVRFLRAPRHWLTAALAGAAAGISVLSGHHSAPIIILASVAGLTAYMLVTRGRWRMYLPGLALFGLFFGLLGAAQALPATEYWRVALRYVNAKEPVTFAQQIPYFVHRTFSLDAASLPGLVVNGFHREAALNPFLGLTLVVLAAIGFHSFHRRFYARLFLFLAAFSILLALGENSVLHGLFYARFPLFDKLRNPSMFILSVHVALLVLAALGLESVRQGRVDSRWSPGLLKLGGAVFVLITILYAVDPAKVVAQSGFAQSAFFAVALGLAIMAPSAQARLLTVALLIFVETGANTTRSYPDREMGFVNLEKLTRNDDVAGFLHEQRAKAPFRISVDDSVGPQCFGDWYGLEQVNGCFAISANISREQWRPEVHALLGSRYFIGPKPSHPYQQYRYTGKSGVQVWESPEYAPWTWTAHQFERVTEDEIDVRYERPWPAVREPMFSRNGAATPAQCPASPDTVRLTDLRPEYGRVEAQMGCRGLLVYSSAYLPGWQATVDGKPAPLLEAYGKLLAVEVDAGQHVVEFRYAPKSVWLGAGLSLAGVVVLAVWCWRRRSGC